jgi:hypothetical protein
MPPMTTDKNKELLDRLVARGRTLRVQKSGAARPARINTRVFNCFRLTKIANQEGRVFRPLFYTEAMNACLVSKEVVPSHMKALMRPHQLATKVHFPYSDEYMPQSMSRVGGKSVYVGEANFERKLDDHFLGSQPEEVRAHDIEILRMFDMLPSLDPFLIRDKFDISELAIDEVYLQIPLEEWQDIKNSIISKFRPLARIAFSGVAKDEDLELHTLRLVEKMWEAVDVDLLKPLTMAMRIETNDAAALYYAWKGIVYYDYKISNMQSDLTKMMEFLFRLHKDRTMMIYNGTVTTDWQVPLTRLKEHRSDLNAVMGRYHKVYDDFFVKGEKPVEFRQFFAIAEDLFWFLGGTISILDSCIEQHQKFVERGQFVPEALIDLWKDLVELTKVQ